MNLDSRLSYPKQLIGGERRDKGLLQIFFQSTDTQPANQGAKFSTGLNGVYDLRLMDIKVISSAAAGSEFAVQLVSDTLKLDRGSALASSQYFNDTVKFVHWNGAPEIPSPILLRQMEIKNWIDMEFIQLGTIGADINSANYNVLLTIEYERL